MATRWGLLETRIEGNRIFVGYDQWHSVLAFGATVGSPALEAVYTADWRDHGTDELYYTKDPLGVVRFRGSVERTASPAVPAENLLTMPRGYRPSRNPGATVLGFSCPSANATHCKLTIDYTGVLVLAATTTAADAAKRIYLDGIAYLAEDE